MQVLSLKILLLLLSRRLHPRHLLQILWSNENQFQKTNNGNYWSGSWKRRGRSNQKMQRRNKKLMKRKLCLKSLFGQNPSQVSNDVPLIFISRKIKKRNKVLVFECTWIDSSNAFKPFLCLLGLLMDFRLYICWYLRIHGPWHPKFVVCKILDATHWFFLLWQ